MFLGFSVICEVIKRPPLNLDLQQPTVSGLFRGGYNSMWHILIGSTVQVSLPLGIRKKLREEKVINRIMLEPMPKKAFIEIDELAASAELLISDAARNITAQVLLIDGGQTAR
jgi:NAD(P)-dependent dehydrogenase (short-subunit alcohol dehydrogenase family)